MHNPSSRVPESGHDQQDQPPDHRARRQRVAFEIDVAEPHWSEGWSVVALGTLELVEDPERLEMVNTTLESWAPGTRHVLRLDIEQMTGRRIIGTPLT